ncbi:hypothetical protein LTR62_006801 [Meristemomyces frigidus]|uniref:Uncharacterized protein n=1 Tax=Meristemomyces frigidus TaxID=1508187 RepID=A0AAN7TC96_9PEZI|nr:hypothetical protein LTR62_006801 [Meristemomyces frigidus]
MYVITAAAVLGLTATAFAQSTPCSPMPIGYGPVPSPNTEAAFKTFSSFASAASNAITPQLYQRIFTNLNASETAGSSNVYLGYYELKTYDPASCTAICDTTSGCVGTNLYFERDPSLVPGDACPNPTALTLIKWSPVTVQAATNDGQYQAQFHVLIAGSNGYMKLPSQACSAISSAWGGDSYSFPTGAGQQNWQSWTQSAPANFRAATSFPNAAIAGAGRFAGGPPGGGMGGW